MKTQTIITLLAILLVSCAPVSTPAPISTPTDTPQPTETFTPEPTATSTPKPTVTPAPTQLSGMLFLDANGSGLRDKASFICPERNAAPTSLEYSFSGVCSPDNVGELVTATEPSLEGFTVCKANICTTTNANGKYALVLTDVKDGENIKLAITDPNSGDPALALRYVNIWNKAVVVPAYEMNGIQIPEQHLNDTAIISIENGFSAKIGADNQTGLTQGYVLFPLSKDDFTKLEMIQGFDQDPSPKVVDFAGNTSKCNAYNICQIMSRRPGQALNGIGGNDHTGIDYGYYGLPNKHNIFIYAAKAGYAQIRTENGNIDILEFLGQGFGGSARPIINNGHTAYSLVADGAYVYPGQIIGIMGNTGTAKNWTHLHFEVQYEKPVSNGHIGFSKDFYAQVVQDFIIPGFNDISVWTVYNLPVFSIGTSAR